MSVLSSAVLLLQAKNYSGAGNWLDESGNSHDATILGTPVHNGDHFTLNGSTDTFQVTNHADLNFADGEDFTVMAVIRQVTIGAAYTYVMKRAGFAATDPGYMLYTSVALNDLVAIELADGTTENTDGKGTLVADTIHVVAGRRDDTTPELEAFLDGVGSGSPNTTNYGSLSNTDDLYIGSAFNTFNFMTGDIFAVALWRSALSDADISTAGDELTTFFPSAPSFLTATAVSTSQINLEWGSVAGAGGYDIERDGSVIASDQPGFTYNDTGRSTGTSYDYRVRAVS